MSVWRDFLRGILSGIASRPQQRAGGRAVPVQDLTFLDEIAAIEPSRLAAELRTQASVAIRESNALKLIALAEYAMLAGQWQGAAQLFVSMMYGMLDARYTAADAASQLVAGAKKVILLTAREQAALTSPTELLIYGHGRIVAALQADGMQQPNLDEWIIIAFSRVLGQLPDRRQAMKKAVALLHPDNTAITQANQAGIGAARRALQCSLQLTQANLTNPNAANRVAVPPTSTKRILSTLAALGGIAGAIFFFAYLFRYLLSFPAVSFFLDDSWALGSIISTALVAWPPLLIASWIFALLESRRKRAFSFITPWHLLRDGGIIAGEITPFSRDWFFHIFQFVWILPLAGAWFLFRDYQTLQPWLAQAWNPAAKGTLQSFIWGMDVTKWISDVAALAAAVLFAGLSVRRQRAIQAGREQGADVYWWDRRIGNMEWLVRIVMVAFDVFLASFLVVKMLAILLVAIVLTIFVGSDSGTDPGLAISYFSPDGVGGLKHLTDMLMHLCWVAALFGMFVFASLLLHWNLREYRWIDLTLFVTYCFILLVLALPLGILEVKFSAAKEARLEELTKPPRPVNKLDEAATYVKNVNLVRDWPVSALNIGILGNPVLPLGFQFAVFIVQFLVRGRKLPKLPIPGLGSEEESKTAHEASG